ncbi:toll-like receptor Tollo [Varroa jacobsoni]|uniref:TIR domain-containing protein n=1 Tax=Varroa destructor TaxID=109461 RepID=A0A7M7JRI4_VARDE|nr:toll-like receptor Tollo [Varroa destructor]XP_022656114.1 toll-like receptor Tollo [Varroa destructor]XP_022656115.1 toll-like receptor Tollo [Varroa destructor]XP_022656116.1 toll-like receptor Tollo [Varroa destructor]XP_022703735.1 toll-like receptor Tollo [Varroa jacobsoni]XP_022703736.1 toll-like receptor Tollo [Varroa jacobsoni]XP_022703737.1 toll-like receptor Tollo [Varroa jacobsoni]
MASPPLPANLTLAGVVSAIIVLFPLIASPTVGRYVSADDCDWQTLSPGAPEVAMRCRFQSLRAGPDATNFSLIQPDTTRAMSVVCDALFTESQLANGTFETLRQLRSLSIERCKLEELPSHAFSGLTELSNLTVRTHNGEWGAISLSIAPGALNHLKTLERLDMAHNNMVALPRAPFCQLESLQSLNLTHNSLTDLNNVGLSSDDCQLNGLLELDLSSNKLRYVDDRAFENLSNLKKLYLQRNELAQMVETALSGLSRLQLLDMSNNRLNTLPPKVLQGSADLKELYLQNNSIGLLSPTTFRGLQQLVVLNLSDNQISSEWIAPETFADLIRLVVLHLSNNRLRHINATAFASQYSLQILHLDGNQIETIDDNAFNSLYNLHTLILSGNRLQSLDAFTFNGLYVLSNLALDGNLLSSLHPDAFRNCSSLQDLELSENQLSQIPRGLQHLRFLRALDLSGNLIDDVTNLTSANLTNLHSLSLARNRIGNMTKGTFAKFRSLRRLDLSRNQIGGLDHAIFDDAPALNTIQLQDNLLRDINGLFMNLAHLRLLNVSRNAITWFDYALVPAALKHLDLHSNEIEVLGNYFEMESAMHLKILDVSHNRLREINAASIPHRVESVALSNNLISVIHPFTFMLKANLSRVDLSNNRLQNIDINALRLKATQDLNRLPEFRISENPFFCDCTMEWMQKINALDESRQYPRVVDLDRLECQLPFSRRRTKVPLLQANQSDFLCKYKSHCFALCHCCEFDACDCEMTCPDGCSCYADSTWNSNVVDCSFTSHSVIPVRVPMDVTELYLDGNDMPQLASHSFIGRKQLRVVYLNNSNVQVIRNRTFTGLANLQALHLDHNKITALHGHEFDNLTTLRELYLSHNRLNFISNVTFSQLRSLRVLHLDNNYIVEFQVWILSQNPLLTELRLGHNPWSCECRFQESLFDWAQMFGANALQDASATRCRGNDTLGPPLTLFNATACATNRIAVTGSTTNGNALGGFTNGVNQIEAADDSHYLGGVIPDLKLDVLPIVGWAIVGLILFLIVVVLIICIAYRKDIRVWIYAHYGVRLFERRREEPEKLFDAFISYCKKDEPFVAQLLAPELECGSGGAGGTAPYRLCLRYRDLPMSGYVAEAIGEAIECSRRSIVVLSEQFLRSEWCRFELKSAARDAHVRGSTDGGSSLVVIVLDKGAMRLLDAEARLSLRGAPVIQWGEKRFWEKLRYALPDPQASSRKQQVMLPHGQQVMLPSDATIHRYNTTTGLHSAVKLV